MKAEDVVQLINNGGWQVTRGSQLRLLGHNTLIIWAQLDDDKIVLNTSTDVLPVPLTDGRTTFRVEGEPERTHLIIQRPYTISQQRKKVDGGGYHDVERIGTFLQLENEDAKKRNEIVRREREALAREQAHKAFREKVALFLDKQVSLAGNGRVVRMYQGETALVIEFENGHKLYLDSYGQGDGYNAELRIAGSDTFNPTSQWDDLESINALDLIKP